MTTDQDIRQENPQLYEFLRQCLIAGRHPETLEAIKAVRGRVNWQKVETNAEDQFILPLLYRNLHGSDILPEELEESLHANYLETAQRNLEQLLSLKALLIEFRKDHIPCVVLKGLSLAVSVYGNIAVRPCRDTDLLFHPKDVPKVLATVQRMGYQYYKMPVHPQNYLQFENEILLHIPESDIFLEIHWSLFDSPYYQRVLDLTWFWEHSMPVSIANTTILSLTPEANLIYLCAHLVLHHRGDELLWLNDIAELVHRYQDRIDWRTIIDKAAEFHLVLPLRQILNQISRDWCAPVPEIVLLAINDYPISSEEMRIFNSLTGDRPSAGQQFWIDFKYLHGWGKKVDFATQLLFPSVDYMKQRYGVSKAILLPLYYPYRWWLGITSYFAHRK